MAIVQRPLGAPIALASEHLRSAADLVGKTVGITGVPSDLAALDTVVAHAGGDPAKVKVVTIGFDGVADLEAGKIAAFTGYWPDDGVTPAGQRPPDHRLQARLRTAGPAYPGLVAFTTRSLIARDPALVRAFVRATVHGYEDTLRDPARSLARAAGREPVDRAEARARVARGLPADLRRRRRARTGRSCRRGSRRCSRWLVAHHLIAQPGERRALRHQRVPAVKLAASGLAKQLPGGVEALADVSIELRRGRVRRDRRAERLRQVDAARDARGAARADRGPDARSTGASRAAACSGGSATCRSATC